MKIRRLLIAILLPAALLLPLATNAHPQNGVTQAPTATTVAEPAPQPIVWSDLSGKRFGMSEISAAKATVFFFTSCECPIAAQYVGRMNAVARDYSPKGVRFFLVNSNVNDSRGAFAAYLKQRNITIPGVKDDKTTLADRLNAQVTPSAVLVDNSGTIRYNGRIDDNLYKEQVRKSDLRDSLDALLTNQPIKVTRNRPLGCSIWRESAIGAKIAATKLTYARDIAPLLNQNCVVCHRAGEVAPFALDSYANAKTWAQAIKQYTARRIMPPWKPVAQQANWFHDARYLTDSQIKSIGEWVDAGAPSGDLKKTPALPNFYPAGSWPLGKPDLVLQPVGDYHLDAEGRDIYRNFTLPIDFDKDTYVSAWDFMPGNRRIVHHIIAYIDVNGKTVALKDNKEKEPGWSVSGGGSGIDNDEWGAGWAAGMTARRYDSGIAVKIPKGAKLVLQVHYHKSGVPETDRTKLAIYLAKEPVTQVLYTAPVGTPWINLKPGVKDQKVTTSFTTPIALTVREVLPHMHLLGTEMNVTAILPDGTVKPIIYVKNWEFQWQMGYRYKEPIHLPKGTKITVTALYDNTAENPYQPSNPPQLVRFGEQSTDEMCFAFLGITIDKKAAGGAPVGTPGAGL